MTDTERACSGGRETGVRADDELGAAAREVITGDVGEREVTREEMDIGD